MPFALLLAAALSGAAAMTSTAPSRTGARSLRSTRFPSNVSLSAWPSSQPLKPSAPQGALRIRFQSFSPPGIEHLFRCPPTDGNTRRPVRPRLPPFLPPSAACKLRGPGVGYRGVPRHATGLVIVILENALRLRCTRSAALAAQCTSALGPIRVSCGRPGPGEARERRMEPSRKGLPSLRRTPREGTPESKQRRWQSCRMRGRPPLPATLAGWSGRTML